MKHKNMKQVNAKKSNSLPPTEKTLHFPSFFLLCNAIICLKDIKVVQFKRKFNYIIPRREFFTSSKKKIELEFRVNP